MSDNLANIVLLAAAASVAGTTNENDPNLIAAAKELKAAASEGSRIMQTLAEFDGVARDGSDMQIKNFTGVVLNIKKEEKTARGVVSVYTGTDHPQFGSLTNPHPHPISEAVVPGVEYFRTEITRDNQAARDLCNHIGKDLVGHRVVVTLKLETNPKTGMRYRTLIAIKDMGEPEGEFKQASQQAFEQLAASF